MTKNDAKVISHRMPKALHSAATRIAKEKKISLTQLINEVMANYTGESIDIDVIEEFRQRLELLEKEVFKKK